MHREESSFEETRRERLKCAEFHYRSFDKITMHVLRRLQEISDALSRHPDLYRNRKIIDDIELASKFDPAQPRDDLGRWTDGNNNGNSQGISKPADKLSTSEKGVDFIKRLESFRGQAYRDESGKPTIGYGHLLQEGEECPNGISRDGAQKLLVKDIHTAQTAIQDKVEVNLAQCQFDALTSLVFTIGRGKFGKSTLLRLLNKGDYNGAADQFPEWNKITVNGVRAPSAGLTKRRELEQNLFLYGKYE